MNLKYLLPLLLAVVALSCENTSPQNHKLEDVVWVARKCTDGSNEEILCPYSYLRFYKNGTFAAGALRGFVSGSWQSDTILQQLLLIPDSLTGSDERAPTLFQLAYHSTHYLNLAMVRDETDIETGNIKLLKMKAATIPSGSDPFDPDLQSWRKTPASTETQEQIKARVLLYVRFLENFYRFAASNKIEDPDTDWFPNVMYMESRGSVRLSYSTELKDWYGCFYNEAQAIEGYKMISGPFLKINLKSTPNLNERNADVARQILTAIEAAP